VSQNRQNCSTSCPASVDVNTRWTVAAVAFSSFQILIAPYRANPLLGLKAVGSSSRLGSIGMTCVAWSRTIKILILPPHILIGDKVRQMSPAISQFHPVDTATGLAIDQILDPWSVIISPEAVFSLISKILLRVLMFWRHQQPPRSRYVTGQRVEGGGWALYKMLSHCSL
jgi:hypothetical protein